jgi:hypothetical protein
MVAILEDFARNGGDSAKVQAIRMLLAIWDDEPVTPAGFEDLYGVASLDDRRKGPRGA